LFFQIDPLVAFSNALSTHALYRGLLWSLVVLIPTMVLGRFFCGWICPLGSLHHFFSSLRSERKRGKQLIQANRYKRWQSTKYYLLLALLAAALMGTGIVGWLDPLSLLVRSLGLSILPGTNYTLQQIIRNPIELKNKGRNGNAISKTKQQLFAIMPMDSCTSTRGRETSASALVPKWIASDLVSVDLALPPNSRSQTK
jgi:hypothetical protein